MGKSTQRQLYKDLPYKQWFIYDFHICVKIYFRHPEKEQIFNALAFPNMTYLSVPDEAEVKPLERKKLCIY